MYMYMMYESVNYKIWKEAIISFCYMYIYMIHVYSKCWVITENTSNTFLVPDSESEDHFFIVFNWYILPWENICLLIFLCRALDSAQAKNIVMEGMWKLA